VKQMERTANWKPNLPLMKIPHFSKESDFITKCVAKKKSLQTLFRQQLSANELNSLQALIIAKFDKLQLVSLKYVVAFHFKITQGTALMVEGTGNELWCGTVLQLLGYYVDGKLYAVYVELEWFKLKNIVHTYDETQYTFIDAQHSSLKDFVSLATVKAKLLVTDDFPVNVGTNYPLIIDACYYVRKWHNLIDDDSIEYDSDEDGDDYDDDDGVDEDVIVF